MVPTEIKYIRTVALDWGQVGAVSGGVFGGYPGFQWVEAMGTAKCPAVPRPACSEAAAGNRATARNGAGPAGSNSPPLWSLFQV